MNTLTVRSFNATSISSDNSNDALFKTIGIILALSSGFFIGSSFVFKKKGLLQAGGIAGKGHAYLANSLWWMGMILMIIGEICNFVAYAFTQAILVTPLGALSVVISAVLSSIFLKERLTFEGKVGCALCVMGATIIVMHAPAQQTAPTIQEFKNLFFAPATSIIIIWKIAPKWGSKNLFVYIGVCSLIGSLSVVTTQGIGTAIVTTITKPGENQFKEWFFYVLSAFVIVTLLTEINYLNKALNLFNTAMVTPVYYVTFTGLTIISSAILSQGFKSAPISIATVVMGFFVICSGIILLFKSKKDDSSFSKNAESDNLKKEDENEHAFGIRASLGSIHRLSRSYPSQNSSTLPTNNKEYSKEYDNKESIGKDDGKQSQHISIQSSRFSAGLPPINESSMNLYPYREDNREVYNTTPNESNHQ
ncbi:6433_t:CDS:2 [Diversispora eburnea]|uniref:6433_t:CDS:1 n=2 Tax=Diversisporales TaxID=214509 RepID=A0A9N8VV35_9GLOM|nr:6433_t:CDS:2 [Diversispora eburnea]